MALRVMSVFSVILLMGCASTQVQATEGAAAQETRKENGLSKNEEGSQAPVSRQQVNNQVSGEDHSFHQMALGTFK